MHCSKCGVATADGQTLCVSCASQVARGGFTYELYLPDATTNKRAYNLTMEITRKNLEQVTKLLSRPHAVIASGLTLNRAAEIKSKFLRLGIEADFRRQPELKKTENGSSQIPHSFTDEAAWQAAPPLKELEQSSGAKDINKKQYRVSNPQESALSSENNLADLLRMLLLILTIILFVAGLIFGILYLNKREAVPVQPPAKSAIATPASDSFGKEFQKGLVPSSTSAELAAMAERGSLYQQPSAAVEKQAVKAIGKMLDQPSGTVKAELNKELEKVESSTLQTDLAQVIARAKERLQLIRSSMDKMDSGIAGELELVGTRFQGSVNLPDQTVLQITTQCPDKRQINESVSVDGYGFNTRPQDSLPSGSYRVTVRLAELSTQLRGLQEKLAGLQQQLEKSSEGKLLERVITVKEAVTAVRLLPPGEVQQLVGEMLQRYFGAVKVQKEVQVDGENIVVKGQAADARQFLLQTAAGLGFASTNSNWQARNLVVIVNDRKYRIALKVCRESMQMVNNDYQNPLFAANIIKNLQ